MVKKAPSAGAGERVRNSHRGGGPKATTTDPADPAQLIADLQGQLAECGAERDAAPPQESATRFTHPPPPRATGRTKGCAALPDRIAARSPGDPGRAGVGVMPRTDPW